MNPDTIGRRTGLYLLMVVLSLLFAAAGVWLARLARPRLGTWNATLCGLGAYAAAVGVAMLVLPTVSEIPGPLSDDAGVLVFPGFAADDLFEFRLYAVGTQLVIWLTIGLLGGALLDRLLNRIVSASLRDGRPPADAGVARHDRRHGGRAFPFERGFECSGRPPVRFRPSRRSGPLHSGVSRT